MASRTLDSGRTGHGEQSLDDDRIHEQATFQLLGGDLGVGEQFKDAADRARQRRQRVDSSQAALDVLVSFVDGDRVEAGQGGCLAGVLQLLTEERAQAAATVTEGRLPGHHMGVVHRLCLLQIIWCQCLGNEGEERVVVQVEGRDGLAGGQVALLDEHDATQVPFTASQPLERLLEGVGLHRAQTITVVEDQGHQAAQNGLCFSLTEDDQSRGDLVGL